MSSSPRVTLIPKVVEHLVGDHRVIGFRGLTRKIEEAINAWAQSNPRRDKFDSNRPVSVVLDIWPLSELDPRRKLGHDHRFITSVFDWDSAYTQFRLRIRREDGSVKLLTQCPLRALVSSRLIIEGGYTVYIHVVEVDGKASKYIGITKQGWTARYRQHLNASLNASPYLFHEALRRRDGRTVEIHIVQAVGCSFDEAMALEEKLVAGSPPDPGSLYPHGLNMIPGGFAGLAYLGKYGFKNIGHRQWEARSRLLREFAAHCDRESRPNPLMAARWRDDEYAKSIIFGNPNNFTEDQVAEIRYMASLDHPVEMIAEQFRCDLRRIKFLIGGQTYSRV
jgi:hypothetical protein